MSARCRARQRELFFPLQIDKVVFERMGKDEGIWRQAHKQTVDIP